MGLSEGDAAVAAERPETGGATGNGAATVAKVAVKNAVRCNGFDRFAVPGWVLIVARESIRGVGSGATCRRVHS